MPMAIAHVIDTPRVTYRTPCVRPPRGKRKYTPARARPRARKPCQRCFLRRLETVRLGIRDPLSRARGNHVRAERPHLGHRAWPPKALAAARKRVQLEEGGPAARACGRRPTPRRGSR